MDDATALDRKRSLEARILGLPDGADFAGTEVALDFVSDGGFAIGHGPTSASSQLRTSAQASASERRAPQNIGPIASCAICTSRQRSLSFGAKAACVDNEGSAAICFWASISSASALRQ